MLKPFAAVRSVGDLLAEEKSKILLLKAQLKEIREKRANIKSRAAHAQDRYQSLLKEREMLTKKIDRVPKDWEQQKKKVCVCGKCVWSSIECPRIAAACGNEATNRHR